MRAPRRTARIYVLAPLGAAILAVPGGGCGGKDETGSAPPAAAGIEARDFAFEPADHSVENGEVVRWTNTGETIHNVKGSGFFSSAINPGDAYEHRFNRPGTYRYLCNLHPTMMRGTIEVTR